MSNASSRTEPDAGPLPATTGAAGWRLILDPLAAPAAAPAVLSDFAHRLARLVGPAQAAAVLAPAARRHGLALLPAEQVAQARLLAKRARHHQLAALRLLAGAGIAGVVLKGFDFAHRLYDDPLDRIGQDLDLLLRPGDIAPALHHLLAAGWRFGRPVLPAWGSIARASLSPLLSPDGATQVDLHREADEWPLSRVLPTAQLLAAAESFRCEDLTLRAPRAEDSLLLLVSNLGKDKFGPLAARKLLDAARLIARDAPDPARLVARARQALLARPLATMSGLLRELGLALPPPWPATPRGSSFARLLDDQRGLALRAPSGAALLRREIGLAAHWRVAASRNLQRARGLVRLDQDRFKSKRT